MTRAVFGQRAAKEFAIPHEGVLREHAEYRAETNPTTRPGKRIALAAACMSVCLAGFVLTLTLTSDHILPMVLDAGRLIARSMHI